MATGSRSSLTHMAQTPRRCRPNRPLHHTVQLRTEVEESTILWHLPDAPERPPSLDPVVQPSHPPRGGEEYSPVRRTCRRARPTRRPTVPPRPGRYGVRPKWGSQPSDVSPDPAGYGFRNTTECTIPRRSTVDTPMRTEITNRLPVSFAEIHRPPPFGARCPRSANRHHPDGCSSCTSHTGPARSTRRGPDLRTSPREPA